MSSIKNCVVGWYFSVFFLVCLGVFFVLFVFYLNGGQNISMKIKLGVCPELSICHVLPLPFGL